MPTILQVVTAEESEISGTTAPYVCRLSEAGTITLPVVGEIDVAGRTLAEIELAVVNAFHPEYTVSRPSVFARVLEYKTAKISVAGAVNKPGVYSLRSDQTSLVALLMEAEGIVDEGAAFIQITHADQAVPDGEAASIETVERAVEQSPDLNEGRFSGPSARHPDFNKIDVQLRFRPPAASGTTGGLTITYGQETLLAEQLDIGSEIERRALLEKLIQREPRVSAAVVNQRLRALAERLRPGSGTWNSENETANESIISVAKLDSNEAKTPALIASGARVLYARAASPTISYGLRNSEYGAMSGNAGFFEKFDTDDSTRTSAVGRALYETDLKENPEIAGQVSSANPQEPRSLVLPVKGLNIPFVDVALRDGDRVIVERLREPMITVVGLVNKAGNFPYRPDVQYNLMHALGFAGGLNMSAEPRYATVYRLAADGTTVSAIFNIAGIAKSADPTGALSVVLKPYDVVAVEHTPRTRAKVFWDRVFRFYISTHITSEDVFGED
jgi:protein involved in polysaccharide export with SLBB domain